MAKLEPAARRRAEVRRSRPSSSDEHVEGVLRGFEYLRGQFLGALGRQPLLIRI